MGGNRFKREGESGLVNGPFLATIAGEKRPGAAFLSDKRRQAYFLGVSLTSSSSRAGIFNTLVDHFPWLSDRIKGAASSSVKEYQDLLAKAEIEISELKNTLFKLSEEMDAIKSRQKAESEAKVTNVDPSPPKLSTPPQHQSKNKNRR